MSDNIEFTIKGEISSLNLKHGDLIVFKTDRELSYRQYEQISKILKELFPENKAFMIDKNTNIEILRQGTNDVEKGT